LPSPISPELAPEQHHPDQDFERIAPLAHAASLADTSPSLPQQNSPDPTSPEPPSKLCQTAPSCLTDLFDELPHGIPVLQDNPLPPVNTLHPSPQLPHAVVLPEHPHKQQRTRASSLSPSDDEQASEKESTLESAKDKSFETPSAEKHANWGAMSTTQRRNWHRDRKKKLSAMGGK
jgi:hypothetical protein